MPNRGQGLEEQQDVVGEEWASIMRGRAHIRKERAWEEVQEEEAYREAIIQSVMLGGDSASPVTTALLRGQAHMGRLHSHTSTRHTRPAVRAGIPRCAVANGRAIAQVSRGPWAAEAQDRAFGNPPVIWMRSLVVNTEPDPGLLKMQLRKPLRIAPRNVLRPMLPASAAEGEEYVTEAG